MNFLWPQAWFLAVLAAPVVLLYLIRTRPKQRTVSTLLFWEDVRPPLRSSPLWRKLRRLISLLVQLLFLLLLILALARPLPPWQGRNAEAVVIVIDASASMAAETPDGRTRLREALGRVRDRITNLRPDDEAMLIVAGETPRIAARWSSSRRTLLDAAGAVATGRGPADTAEALALADALAGIRGDAVIHFLTDGVSAGRVRTTAPLEIIRVGSPDPVNMGLTHLSARRSRLDAGTVLARVGLVRSDEAGAESVTDDQTVLELRVNGRIADRTPVRFDDGNRMVRTWSLPSPGPLRIEARIVPPPEDALAADDAASVGLGAAERVGVRLVSEPNLYLEAALAAIPFADATRVDPDDLAGDTDADLYLFHRSTPPDGFHPRAMVLIRPEGEGGWGRRLEGRTAEAVVTDWRKESDPLRSAPLETVVFSSFARYETPPGAEVFAESFGEPVLFGEWSGGRRWIVAAFGLEETDLVYRTVFPILIGNLLRSLARTDAADTAPLPGENQSRLRARTTGGEAGGVETTAAASRTGPFPRLPLHGWLLLAAAGWTLLEWRLFHRRITE
ncbi:MAG: vWA domain-containing protein [Puniceicoccaceae bacterium]